MEYVLSFLSMIAGVIYLSVGISTYTLNKNSGLGKAFLLLTTSLAIWALAYSNAYVTTDNTYVFSFWNKLSALGWCFFPALLLFMILVITDDRSIYNPFKCILLFIPAFFFCILTVFVFPLGGNWPNGLYRFFNLSNPIYNYLYTLIGMIRLLVWKHKTSHIILKKQVGVILTTGVITYILALIGEFVIPRYAEGFLNSTQIFGVIMILGIYHAIRKYNFLLTPNELIINELFKETMDFEFLIDLDGRIIRINRQAQMVLGYETEDLVSTKFEKILGNEPYQFRAWVKGSAPHRKKHYNISVKMKQGETIPVNMTIVPIKGTNNDLELGYLIIAQDIRPMEELKLEMKRHKETVVKLKESEEMFSKLMDSIPDLVLVTDMKGRLSYCSKSIKNFLGYDISVEELPEHVFAFLEKGSERQWSKTYKGFLNNEINHMQLRYHKKDGELRYAEVKASALKDESKEAFGFVFVARDITDRKKEEIVLARRKAEIEKINEELVISNELFKEKAVKDSLTNLHNHEYILEILEREVEQQKQSQKGLAVMMLDIDHFKRVNDTYGHQKGDQVLTRISEIIQSCLRNSDFAGRYGGEEFMIILSGVMGISSAIEVAERIKECISNCVFENNELHVTISIGLACYQGESTKELVGIADKLLYQAKGNGRNRIEYHKE
jgi:diguanylate cyclase (GGDEF)-like protein/PAS domain S-box-containing protein